MVAGGLLISSNYLINVDVPLLASGSCSAGGVIFGISVRGLMKRDKPFGKSAKRGPTH
jgi:hypothetical protein